LNFFEKLGFLFYKKIDIDGAIFKFLKEQKLIFRIFIYLCYYLCYFFTIYMLGYYIFKKIGFSFNESNFIISSIFFLGFSLLTLFPLTLLFYEALYKKDINLLLDNYEKKMDYIAKEKKEWWRLRNRHFLIRILFYLIFSFISIEIVYWICLHNFLSDIKNINLLNKVSVNNFLKSVNNILNYFSIFLGMIFVYIEFRIYKIKKNILVSNGNRSED